MSARYDRIGRGYAQTRRPDARIAKRIHEALGDARSVVNVGAGTGAYEPTEIEVIAVEPSEVMIRQRLPGAAPVVKASAEALPLPDDAVDAAMAVLTIHHWTDPRRGIAEMLRVARDRVVIVTLDAEVAGTMWLYDYAPEIAALTRAHFPPIADLERWLPGALVEPILIPADCTDCFLESFWSRPELVLDPRARAGTSGFARLSPRVERRIVDSLARDLESGEWERLHGTLRARSESDGGLRLVSYRSPKTGGGRDSKSRTGRPGRSGDLSAGLAPADAGRATCSEHGA